MLKRKRRRNLNVLENNVQRELQWAAYIQQLKQESIAELEMKPSMNFIQMFLDFSKECESPTSFFQWAAISTLSAVMRDNVYVPYGPTRIYPNLYVILLADSGAARKGLPLKMAKKFITKIDNTKVIDGRASIQGVIEELARVEQNGTGFISKKDASGLFYSEEFSASLVEDPAAIKVLTDLYDFQERWKDTLRSGTLELKNVCLSLLGASNETLLRDIFTDKAIYGGLLGRTFIIHEKKRRLKNSMMYSKILTSDDEKPLLEHLKVLSKIKGEVKICDKARATYDKWYNSIDDEMYSSKTGFIERVHVGVIKLATCLAASEDKILQTKEIFIEEQHIDEAINVAFKIKKAQQILTIGQGLSASKQHLALFINILANSSRYMITHKELLRKHFTDFDVQELENTKLSLINAGLLMEVPIGNEAGYMLTDVAIKRILEE